MKITVCELSCATGYMTNWRTGKQEIDRRFVCPEYFYYKSDANRRLREVAADFAKEYTPDEEYPPREIGTVYVFFVDVPDGVTLPDDPGDLCADFDNDRNAIDPIIECFMDFPMTECAEAYEDGEFEIR